MASKEKKKYSEQYDQFTGQTGSFITDQTNAGQQAGNGVAGALKTWGDYTGAGIDPEAINRARGVGEKGINDYASMVGGLNASPGYNPAEKAGMRAAVTQPMAGAFRTAEAQIANTGAQTGNAGAAMANAGELAREKSRMMTSGLGQLEGQFGDARRADQQFATQAQGAIPGMAGAQFGQEMANTGQLQFPVGVYGGQQQMATGNAIQAGGTQTNMMGQLNQQAMQPGFLKQLALAGMGAAGQIGGALAGKPPKSTTGGI